MDKYQKLQQSILNVNSILELSEAMCATFEYLVDFFPIDAVSFQRISLEKKNIQFEFLLSEDGFHRFNTDVQLNTSELAIAKQVLEKQDIIFTDSMNKRLLTRKVNKVLSDVIPPKERTYLSLFLV